VSELKRNQPGRPAALTEEIRRRPDERRTRTIVSSLSAAIFVTSARNRRYSLAHITISRRGT